MTAGPIVIVIVDADTLAGWRRPTPSLQQLWGALEDLRVQMPEVAVAVVADASLKWALPADEQETIEDDIRSGRLLFSPAGGVGGHVGFLAKVFEQAAAQGFAPVLITDQAVPGASVGRLRREPDRWVFDLEGVAISASAVIRPHRRRRGRSAA